MGCMEIDSFLTSPRWKILEIISDEPSSPIEISAKINTLTEENNKNYEEINKIKNANIDIEKEVGGFRFVAEAFNVELAQVVKFFIFLIVLVFDPLAVALIIAFNGLISDKKRKQKEALIEMMENDEKLGLYEVYGDKKEDIVENISQNTEDSGKISTLEKENVVNVEKSQQTTSEMPDLKWEEYMHPEFPWANRSLWINNPKAVNFWISTKGGSRREADKYAKEERERLENTKTY